MSLPEKQSQSISSEVAGKQTANYRRVMNKNSPIGGLFWKEYIVGMLNQPGCIAMRYYYGRDDEDFPTLILVGVDKDGNDIANGILLEVTPPCPPYCSNNNYLNS